MAVSGVRQRVAGRRVPVVLVVVPPSLISRAFSGLVVHRGIHRLEDHSLHRTRHCALVLEVVEAVVRLRPMPQRGRVKVGLVRPPSVALRGAISLEIPVLINPWAPPALVVAVLLLSRLG